jgi:hypothetical protein
MSGCLVLSSSSRRFLNRFKKFCFGGGRARRMTMKVAVVVVVEVVHIVNKGKYTTSLRLRLQRQQQQQGQDDFGEKESHRSLAANNQDHDRAVVKGGLLFF